MKLLSIITINYNNADGLKKTIDSVLSQNKHLFSKIEHIIVDGASTDHFSKVIKDAEKSSKYYSKIVRYISEPDAGIYNAMNKGIKIAEGSYVYMLNSGDTFEPDSLNAILDKLSKEKPDLLLIALNLWNNKNLEKIELRTPLYLTIGSMSHQGMIYKKSIHETVGPYDESYRYASDYDFSIRAFFNKNIKVSYIYTPSANFTYGGIGGCGDSTKEIHEIQVKSNFIPPDSTPNPIKNFLKLFIPFGILKLIEEIKCKHR